MNFGPKKDFILNQNPVMFETETIENNTMDNFERHETINVCKSIRINSENKLCLCEKKQKSFTSPLINSLIRKFIQLLKANMSLKILPKSQISNLISLIGDFSYFIPGKKNNALENIKIKTFEIFQRILISPDHSFRMIWNIFSILYLGCCFIYIPIEISFGAENIIFDNFMIFIFSIDIILNFLTAKFIGGSLVIDPKIIILNYLHGYFILDFLALIYSVMEIVDEETEFIDIMKIFSLYKFLILAKVPKFFSYLKTVSNYLKLESKYQEIIDMIKLVSYSLFLAHMLACLWYLISTLNPSKNWIMAHGIQVESLLTKYVYSLYWTIVTIMTVGYGDIVPQNIYEVLFTSFTIIFGCVLYAFNLNSIGIILQNHQRKENEFKNNMRIINNFMDRKNIDIKLQRRVQEYLHFMLNEQTFCNNEEEISIINKLNETLKEELLLESYGGIFMNSPMFVKNFSEKSLRKMVKTIKEVKFFPGEEILEEGIIDDCSLYFINTGSVELYLNRSDLNNQNILKVFKKGETFGEYSFFTGNPRDFSYRSVEFTSVLIINQEIALNIFKENQDDCEMYHMIRDKILMNNDYSLLSYRCFYCRSIEHTIKNCPFLHFIPNIEKIIKTNEFYNEEPRTTYTRRFYPKFSRFKIYNEALRFKRVHERENIYLRNSISLTLPIIDKILSKSPIQTLDFLELEENQIENQVNKTNEINEESKEFEHKDKDLNNSILEYQDVEYEIQPKKNKLNYNEKNKLETRYANTTKNSSINKETSKDSNSSLSKIFENEQKKDFNYTFITNDVEGTFEKMKNYRNYYPEMNSHKIIEHMQYLSDLNIRLPFLGHEYLPDNNIEEEVFEKLQKLKKYSIYTGKFKDLIMQKIWKPLRLNRTKITNLENISMISSPYHPRKTKAFQGFFENKIFLEKSFGSLIMSIVKQNTVKEKLSIKKKNKKYIK